MLKNVLLIIFLTITLKHHKLMIKLLFLFNFINLKRENRAVRDCLGSSTWRIFKLSSHVFLPASTLLFIPTLQPYTLSVWNCKYWINRARKKCLWLWVSASQHCLSHNSDGVPLHHHPFLVSNSILHHFPSLVLLLRLWLPLP